MFFINADNPQPPDSGRPSRRRWTAIAAPLVGLAVLVLFATVTVVVMRPDANRKTLDRIDALMAASDWRQAVSVCRQELDAHYATEQTGPATWTRPADLTADLYLRLGISLSMLERYDEARAALDDGLARSPSDARLAINRALVEYRTGNLDEALVRLQELAKQATYAPHVHYHIGRIYEAKGLYDEALKAYRDELNISSSAGAWQRYFVLKKMRGATTTQP